MGRDCLMVTVPMLCVPRKVIGSSPAGCLQWKMAPHLLSVLSRLSMGNSGIPACLYFGWERIVLPSCILMWRLRVSDKVFLCFQMAPHYLEAWSPYFSDIALNWPGTKLLTFPATTQFHFPDIFPYTSFSPCATWCFSSAVGSCWLWFSSLSWTSGKPVPGQWSGSSGGACQPQGRRNDNLTLFVTLKPRAAMELWGLQS